MGANASRSKYIYDADAGVVLRNIADGAEVADATEAAVSLKQLKSAYWHGGEIPQGEFVVVFQVTDLLAASHSYELQLKVDDVQAMNDSPVIIDRFTVSAPGLYVRVIDSDVINQLDPDNSGTGKWIASAVDTTGATPSITYGAWIAKALRR
jgi:hypothetical protein